MGVCHSLQFKWEEIVPRLGNCMQHNHNNTFKGGRQGGEEGFWEGVAIFASMREYTCYSLQTWLWL